MISKINITWKQNFKYDGKKETVLCDRRISIEKDNWIGVGIKTEDSDETNELLKEKIWNALQPGNYVLGYTAGTGECNFENLYRIT